MLRIALLSTILASTVFACADDAGKDKPGADPNWIPPQNRAVVNVGEDQPPPLFLAYRNGTKAWKELDPEGKREMFVEAKYQVLAVCGSAETGFTIGLSAQMFRTDGAVVEVPCSAASPNLEPDGLVTVTGTMTQPGHVTIGGALQASADPNWNFSLKVEPGMHDIIAVNATSTRVVRQHNVEIAADTQLMSPLNVADDPMAKALFTVNLTMPNLEMDETASTVTKLKTETASYKIGSTSVDPMTPTAKMLPQTLMMDGDLRLIQLVAEAVGTTTTTTRSALYAYEVNEGNMATLELPPRLTDVLLAADRAMWTEALPDGQVELSMSAETVQATVTATRAWLDGETELVLDLDVPGFDPQWAEGLDDPANVHLVITASDDDDTTPLMSSSTSVSLAKQ
jgi:hypothetical protein